MRTFTAILSFLFLLTACDPEIINEKECKGDPFDLLEHQWSSQLDPYYQYNKSKWFEMGDHIGLISSDNQVNVIDKKSGQVSGISIIPNSYFSNDNIHVFNNKLYFFNSISIEEFDPFTGSINTLYDPPAGSVEDFIANDHIMVFNLVDNLRTSFELVMIDLNTRVSKSLTVLNVDPDIGQYFNLSLLHQDNSGKWQLYYNLFSSSSSTLKINKTVRIDLETGQQKTLSEPYGITSQSVAINNMIYSAYRDKDEGTSIRNTDTDITKVNWIIDPNPNFRPNYELHEFIIRENDIVFYANFGYARYDLNSGKLIKEVYLIPPYDFPASKAPVIIGKYLFIPYLRELLENGNMVLGVMDLEKDVYLGDFCDIPAVFNNQSHFVCKDELFVINHAKQIQKYVVRK